MLNLKLKHGEFIISTSFVSPILIPCNGVRYILKPTSTSRLERYTKNYSPTQYCRFRELELKTPFKLF